MINVSIRNEEPGDYRLVEELTREAFWDLHVPGCNEHYLAHLLRDSPDFLPELDFVATIHTGNSTKPLLVGNIMYSNAFIQREQQKPFPVISFGPISILPEYQNMGIGRALILHSLAQARNLGYTAIFIYGDPDFYGRFGFIPAETLQIRTRDGFFSPALQFCELIPNSLNDVSGCFIEADVYEIDEQSAELFDQDFSPKTKGFRDSQLRFQDILSQAHL